MSDVPTKAERAQWKERLAKNMRIGARLGLGPTTCLRLLDALDTYEDALRHACEAADNGNDNPTLRSNCTACKRARALLDGTNE